MKQLTLTHPDGTKLELLSEKSISAPTKATQKMALLSDDLLSISVTSATPIKFQLGDVINVYGRAYRLNQLPQITKDGNRSYSYELQFEGAQYDLLDVTFQLPEGSYGENLYGDLRGLVDALQWNVSRVFGAKWKIKTDVTDTTHKNLSVTGKNCLQVAQELCSEFDVEFSVSQEGGTAVLEFVKSVGAKQAFTLRYGEGKGLYKLQRTNVNNAGVTTRLFCYGSSDNLPQGYRHTKLCLPAKSRLTSYIEDAAALAEFGVKEGEKTFVDIRPERIGTVGGVVSGDVLSFFDPTMNFDLNEKDETGNTKYLIADTVARLKFISGNLGGYEFDISSYNSAEKKFTIKQFSDENGTKFPDQSTAARQFSAAGGGDKYIITEINLPDEYVTDAEKRLEKAGTEALAKISQPQVGYKLTLDENFFIAIYGRDDTEFLHVGDSLQVVDNEVGVNKSVRIVRIERDLLRPHSYDITLSDTVTKTTTTKVINELTEINETIESSGIRDTSKMRRRWMATKELQEMVFDPDGYFDSQRIKPLSVETTMLTVAAKSQQFALVGSLFQPNLRGACNDFYAQGCRLVHYALFDDVITFNLTGCTYSTATGNALNTTTAYYIYARCAKAVNASLGTGVIILDTAQHKAEETSFYYFLIGVLNSAVDGVRAISLTYGATTINGAFITTGRIQSQDENSYIDLDGNAVVMGNGTSQELSWNKNGDGKLRVKGGLVVNDGGEEGEIGLYRGVYSPTATYYPGDDVTYINGETTSTYRQIYTGPCRGIPPTNSKYWQVRAQGSKGDKGDPGKNAVSLYKSTAFVRLPSSIDLSSVTPTGGSWAKPLPDTTTYSGQTFSWSDGIPAGDLQLWATTRTFYSDDRAGTWSTPRKMTDTSVYDVEFSNVESPGTPSSRPYNWHDPSESGIDFSTMIWRAEREYKNGEWGGWVVVRIKGEKGDAAEFFTFDINTRSTKKNKNGNSYTFAPNDVTVKVIKVKGSTREAVSVLPAGYYFKMVQITTDGNTSTSGKYTTPTYNNAASEVFVGSYNYVRFDLYDDNDEVIAHADCSLSEDGQDGQPGQPGQPGKDAPYYLYKYQWNGSRTAYPTPFDPSALNAGSGNWKDAQPGRPGTLYYLWRTVAKVSGDGRTLIERWSEPVRVTPTENTLKIVVKGARSNGRPNVSVYGNDITGTFNRGHNLKVLLASDLSVVYQGNFDTSTDTLYNQSNTAALCAKLSEYKDSRYIILLYSHDALSLFSQLYGLLQKFGCSYRAQEVVGSRFAFAFIGRWGLAPGQGYTHASGTEDSVTVAASVIDGELVPSGADGQIGENLLDNSEIAETFDVYSTSSTHRYFETSKVFPTIPEGQTISGQARITIEGCSFPTSGGEVLLYIDSGTAWPVVVSLSNITANGVYNVKTELQQVPTGVTGWKKKLMLLVKNFYNGGTVTVERVKVEIGTPTDYSLSQNDRKGASTPYRGEYDSGATYYGTTRRTDVVKFNELYYVARADVGAFTGKAPTDPDYWNDYGAQFESVATKLLFSEFAYVENLGVTDLRTAHDGKRVHISKDENAMTIYDADGQTSAVFSGDQFTDAQLFGGADQVVTPSNANTSYQTGNALHSNMPYDDTIKNATFNYAYAGVFSGHVTLFASMNSTLQGGAKASKRMMYATVDVYLDNAIIGSCVVMDPAVDTGTGDYTENTVNVDFSNGISAGTHTLKTVVNVHVKDYSRGHLEVNAKTTFTGCKASSNIRMARYFANGQAVGSSSEQYAQTIIENGKLTHRVRAGGVGLQLQDGTAKMMIGGVWYTVSRDSSGNLKLT